MTPARPRTLAAVGLVVAVLAASGLRAWESRGGAVPPIPGLAVAALVVIAIAVLAVGEPVRRWNSGDRSRRLDPLRAARTVVLAQASALAGAALAGWYAGQAVLVVGELAIEPRRERFVAALLATGGALAMVTAGLVVQRWCRLPPDDDDDAGPSPAGRPDTDQGPDGREGRPRNGSNGRGPGRPEGPGRPGGPRRHGGRRQRPDGGASSS